MKRHEPDPPNGGPHGNEKKQPENTLKRKKKRDSERRPDIITSPEAIRQGLRVVDLRNLALWLLMKFESDSPAPKWARVQNLVAIGPVVSILVPGLPTKMFIDDPTNPKPRDLSGMTTKLPVLEKYFKQVFPILSPRVRHGVVDASVSAFTSVGISKTARKKVEKELKRAADQQKAAASEQGTDNVLAHKSEEFVLDMDFLNFLGYPNVSSSPEYVKLPEPADGFEQRVFGVDCEMCETANGSELTRVAVIGMDEEVIYETLVKPDNEITDYLTRYSGITPELLDGVSTRLEDVQKWFQENVSSKDILLGHSLDCDLKALKIIHHTVIDTAISYVDGRGLPSRPSLRWLASKYLGMEIQNHGEKGHDPLEDARTCVKLLKLKQVHGPDFGAANNHEVRLTKKLVENGFKCAVVDYGIPYWDEGNSQVIISATSDAEVARNVVKLANSGHQFIFGGLRELSRVQKRDGSAGDDVYKALNENLETILSGLPSGTAVILWSGGGDNSSLLDLERRRHASTVAYEARKAAGSTEGSKWTQEDERLLAQAKTEAQLGVAFPCVIYKDADAEPPQKKQKNGTDI